MQMIYHIFGNCSNDLDLLVRCLEKRKKHILPNGGFSRWFTMVPSVKKSSQRCLKQIQAMMFLFQKNTWMSQVLKLVNGWWMGYLPSYTWGIQRFFNPLTNQLRTSSDIQVCDIRHQDTSRKQAFRLFAEEISHSSTQRPFDRKRAIGNLCGIVILLMAEILHQLIW